MKRIAVIGANAPLEAFYQRAKSYGYYIVGIAWEDGAVCKRYCDKFYPVSFTNKDVVLDICRYEQIDGITSFSLESALPTVVYVAQKMGLTSNDDECVLLTTNKFTMRRAFEKSGIPVPKYYLIRNKNELKTINIRYPAIIKPVDSGGSQGVNKVETIDELMSAYGFSRSYSRTGTVIVEEFIDGREFSIEYLSQNGIHYLLQITDKVTSGEPHFVELQHHQPALISKDLHERIKEMVEKALTALKIQNSPSHTEIKLNSNNELFIIEIGARLGGDYITSDLVRLSTGYDMVKGAIDLATNSFSPPQIEEHHFSGVYFYSKLATNVKQYIINSKEYPEIVEAALLKDELEDVYSNADRNGYFLYQSDQRRFNIE